MGAANAYQGCYEGLDTLFSRALTPWPSFLWCRIKHKSALIEVTLSFSWSLRTLSPFHVYAYTLSCIPISKKSQLSLLFLFPAGSVSLHMLYTLLPCLAGLLLLLLLLLLAILSFIMPQ